MARFRDMRSFVRFVKDEHVAMTRDKESPRFLRNETPDSDWPTADEAKAKYAQKTRKPAVQVSDILDDCIAFNYLQFSRTRTAMAHDFSLVMTPQGRHLLLRLGLIREIARDNSEWLNVITAFLVGVLSAALLTLGSVWIFEHTKPPVTEVEIYTQDKGTTYHIKN